jgi:hypothetical protein
MTFSNSFLGCFGYEMQQNFNADLCIGWSSTFMFHGDK